MDDRLAEKEMKRRKKLEAKMKSKKQMKLDVLNKNMEEHEAHSDEEKMNEDTNNFLNNLTFGGGDSDGSIHR